MNIKRSRADRRVSREYEGNLKGLFDDLQVATKLLMRDVLAQHSGTLRLLVSEEAATIKLNGSIVGVSPMPGFEVAGGMHTVTVEKAGFIISTRDLEIQPKQEKEVQVSLLPSPAFVRAYEQRAGLLRTVAWAGIGLGAAGLAGGGLLYSVANDKATALRRDIQAYNQSELRREDTLRDLQQRQATISRLDALVLVSGGIGVAALATGLVMYLTGDEPDRYVSEETAIVLVPTGSGLTLNGSF